MLTEEFCEESQKDLGAQCKKTPTLTWMTATGGEWRGEGLFNWRCCTGHPFRTSGSAAGTTPWLRHSLIRRRLRGLHADGNKSSITSAHTNRASTVIAVHTGQLRPSCYACSVICFSPCASYIVRFTSFERLSRSKKKRRAAIAPARLRQQSTNASLSLAQDQQWPKLHSTLGPSRPIDPSQPRLLCCAALRVTTDCSTPAAG